jgi:N6-adenosine-specific RNA methylase IME4
MPGGMLCIWVPKQLISDVLDVFVAKRFKYVENLVWIRKTYNNAVDIAESQYINSAKETLIMMRKVSPFRLDLRHQRTQDVIFESTRYDAASGRLRRPDAVYEMLETLLPQAHPAPERTGQFVELYVM